MCTVTVYSQCTQVLLHVIVHMQVLYTCMHRTHAFA